jgi:serine/threonine protein kinase
MNPEQLELELARELHRGDGRTVWEAIQKPLGRRVAFVRLEEGLLPSSPRARALMDESRAHARLKHPNIAQVYSFSESATEIAVVMELTSGEDIVEYSSQHPGELLTLLRELASALSYAHAQGVLHGGLDAERVSVVDGSVKIRGFRFIVDSSRAIVSGDLATGVALLCPEVSRGGLFSALSDVYLFGALAYHILTGKPLSGGAGTPQVSAREVATRFLLPNGLLDLVRRCLEPIPADRPESMLAVKEELERIEQDQAREIAAPRRRSRRIFFGAAGALLAMCFVFAVGLVVRSRPSETIRLSRVPVEASDSQKARIRVVARPWARVFVDGDYEDTTPFAALLTVSPGQHLVRLEHPNAPPEERLIEVQKGQIAIVDVEMKVQRSPLPRGEELPFVETTP